jgi:helix-turn-helix protein
MGRSHGADPHRGTKIRDDGTVRDTVHRKRPPLRPLAPGLPEPVAAYAAELRRIYWDRLEINQRELAKSLHLTKSSVSRYLNGQQPMPEQTLLAFGTLAGLSAREQDRARALLARAAAQPDDAGTPRPRGRLRRIAWWLVPAIALAGAGVTVLVVVTSNGDSPTPGCQQTRRYAVTMDGDLLDAEQRIVGKLYRGDVFDLEPAPPPNPYTHRYYGKVLGRDAAGYADQAKLDYEAVACAGEPAG